MNLQEAEKICTLSEKVDKYLPEAIITLLEGNGYELTKEDVEYIYESPKEALGKLWGHIKDIPGKVKGSTVGKKAGEAAEAVGKKAGEFKTWAGKKAGEAGEGIKNKFPKTTEKVGNAKKGAGDWMEGHPKTMKGAKASALLGTGAAGGYALGKKKKEVSEGIVSESILTEDWREILHEGWASLAKKVYHQTREIKTLEKKIAALKKAGKKFGHVEGNLMTVKAALKENLKKAKGLKVVGKAAEHMEKIAGGAGVTGVAGAGVYGGMKYKGKKKEED